SKDITESFIQIRLQNDWLFRDRKWAWNNLRAIMIEEYGFPQTLSSRELSRKWAATYGVRICYYI
ncbi:jg24571, partial [Pararge aegeria aegeria]